MSITNWDKLACATRELAMRRRVYRRLVQHGKMQQDNADREIELMNAIVIDYQRLCEPQFLNDHDRG